MIGFMQHAATLEATAGLPKRANGYVARVVDRKTGAVRWDSEQRHASDGVWETKAEALEAAEAWIRGSWERDQRERELRAKRKEELPGKLQESYAAESRLAAKVRDLNKAKKRQIDRQHRLTAEAEHPRVEMEFAAALRKFRVYDAPSESADELDDEGEPLSDPRQVWIPGTDEPKAAGGDPVAEADRILEELAAAAAGPKPEQPEQPEPETVKAKPAKKAPKKTAKKAAKKAPARAGRDPSTVRWPGEDGIE